MAVIPRQDILRLSPVLTLQVTHFVRGTYPEAAGQWTSYPVNRLLIMGPSPSTGPCVIEDDVTRFDLVPLHAYLIPCFHSAGVRLAADRDFLSIQFHLDLFEGYDLLSRTGRLAESRDSRWWELALESYREPVAPVGTLRLHSLVLDFAALQLSSLPEGTLAFAAGWPELGTVCTRLAREITARQTIGEVAEELGMGQGPFSRRFTETIGIAPKHYLNQLLLKRASQMLLRPDARVKEVAFALDFSNEFYFSRFFRRHIGLSPTEYRQKHLAGLPAGLSPLPASGAKRHGARGGNVPRDPGR